MLKYFSLTVYKEFVYPLALSIFLMSGVFYPSNAVSPKTSYSIAALTWNMGNTEAKDKVVDDFINDLKAHNLPDVIVIGTQEELAKNEEKSKAKIISHQLKDRILNKLNEGQANPLYINPAKAEGSYLTSSGANNSAKTAVAVAAQKIGISQKLNLAQNRSSLAILVKKGNGLDGIDTVIYHPKRKKTAGKGIIVIKGELTKHQGGTPLFISLSSVHLSSNSDEKRRTHANVYFEDEGLAKADKKYQAILKDAEKFYLIMGDFNERNYLMADGSVIDRGYLTNFAAYGYDFSQKQAENNYVYGTYGFTIKHNTTPEALEDSRGRPHNTKGGFLDRVAFCSGQDVEPISDPKMYKTLIDENKFKEEKRKKKLFYSGSDHLPVIRYFNISVGGDDDINIAKRYITRRLPNFKEDIDLLREGLSLSKPEKLEFYDAKEMKGPNLQGLPKTIEDLEALQKKIKDLEDRIKKSSDPKFLESVYKEITENNTNRMHSLENMDRENMKWEVPASLTKTDFKNYQAALNRLVP